MALQYPTLYQPLFALFQTGTPATADAANRIAAAYNAYALGAMFSASKPVFTGSEQARFQATILPAMTPGGSPAIFAAAIQSAVIAFWMGPPIAVAGAQAGVVTAIPGAASIAASLTAVLSNSKNTALVAATQMATILDTATRTTVATVTPPPGTVVPIV